MRRARTLPQALLVLASFSCAVAAVADPRWWWHDRQLTFAAADATEPDVAQIYGEGGRGERFAVAWTQALATGGSEVRAMLTVDGGCTWCGPVTVSSGPAARQPSIAGVIDGSFGIRLQVAYESDGDIWVASAALAPPFSCLSFVGTTWTRTVAPLNAGDSSRPRRGSGPDLAAVGRNGVCPPALARLQHFHLVWEDGRDPAQTEVFYARDLTGDGSGWSTMFRLRDTMAPSGPSYVEPSVAVDESTAPPPGKSAVNVAFAEASTGRILSYRSIDSGLTFSATGGGPGLPVGAPAVVAAGSLAGLSSRPVNDTGFGDCRTSASTWHGVAWQLADGDVVFDGEFRSAPAMTAPGWAAADVVAADPAGGGAALAVTHVRPAVGSAEAWALFEDRGEIAFRPGLLTASDPIAADFTRYPIAPARTVPPDPASVSGPLQLTHCVWDPATGDCDAVRPPGASDATDVTVTDFSPRDESAPATVIAVWSDSRGAAGTRNLWWKRTDRGVAQPEFDGTPAYRCISETEAEADLTIRLVGECGSLVGERIERYLIYYGSDPGGPFSGPMVIASAGLVDPHSFTVPGLTPGATWWFTVIAEDQARNISPAAFDPGSPANAGFGVAQQQLLDIPPCSVVPGCDLNAADLTFPPVAPARSAPWVYSSSCGRLDPIGPAGRVAITTASAGATFDASAPGTAGTVAFYQLSCGCSGVVRMTKSPVAGTLVLDF